MRPQLLQNARRGRASMIRKFLIVCAVASVVAATPAEATVEASATIEDRKSTRLNSRHLVISYAVFCLTKKELIHLVCRLAWFSDVHLHASLPGTCTANPLVLPASGSNLHAICRCYDCDRYSFDHLELL